MSKTDTVKKKYFLHFPKDSNQKPVLYHLVKDYDLVIHIFRARINPDEEGYLVLDLSGSEEQLENGVAYLTSCGVEVNDRQEGLVWNETNCVSCGNCLTHCPTHALYVEDRTSMKVNFLMDKCIECLNCLKICPFDAVSSIF